MQRDRWHDASASDWEVARQREAVIRPLAEQSCLTPALVAETAQTLNLKRSVVYQLVAQYRKRPRTSTLLLGHSGRPRGSRLLEPEREAVIQGAIQHYYFTKERPRIADSCVKLEPSASSEASDHPTSAA